MFLSLDVINRAVGGQTAQREEAVRPNPQIAFLMLLCDTGGGFVTARDLKGRPTTFVNAAEMSHCAYFQEDQFGNRRHLRAAQKWIARTAHCVLTHNSKCNASPIVSSSNPETDVRGLS
jgi:hypothetical protein